MSATSDEAWRLFDAAVKRASRTSPWKRTSSGEALFEPNYDLLGELLAIPIRLGCTIPSGIPAKAVDVWIAHELRRAGFGEDEVWPRATPPRVLPVEAVSLLQQLPKKWQPEIWEQLRTGKIRGIAASQDAHVLGKAYLKQIDVVMARWSRGVELMVSCKRMERSFGKNALNRIEEGYGDAKNLRARHPLAAMGYVIVLPADARGADERAVERLVDLVGMMGREDEAYDATAVVFYRAAQGPADDLTVELDADSVPPELAIDRFFKVMVESVLAREPIEFHPGARERWLDRRLAVAQSGEPEVEAEMEAQAVANDGDAQLGRSEIP